MDAALNGGIEERLFEAEERYRTLVEQLPAATYVCACDEVATHLYVSPQIEALMGYTPQEWMADPNLWIERIHPDDRGWVLEEMRRTLAEDLPYSVEYRAFRRDGRMIWLRDQDVVVHDQEGRPLYTQGLYLDITERKEAEQQLRHQASVDALATDVTTAVTGPEPLPEILQNTAEALLSHLDAGSVRIWTVDAEDQTAELQAVAGIDPDSPPRHDRVPLDSLLLSRTVRSRQPFLTNALVDTEEFAGVTWAVREGITSLAGYPFVVEDRVLGFLAVFAPRPLAEDSLDALRAVADRVAQAVHRKRAEEALRESEARYRALVEGTSHVVWTKRADGSLDEAAPLWAAITGQPVDEARGEGWLQAVHPDDRERTTRLWKQALVMKTPYENEYRARRPDGGYDWWLARGMPVLEADGSIREWVGSSTNITERKLAEEALKLALVQEREAARRLRALDEMKNTFLAAVSHELRTPLAAVLGSALTLEREDIELTPEVRGELVGGVVAAARKLDRLLSDLLDLDRLARGIVLARQRPADVGSIVRRAVEQSPVFGERAVRVEADPLVVPVDAPKVERIVENLVMNAARHTHPDTEIWVRVRPAEDGVEISVEDDGPGVPDDIKESIFEPFRRGEVQVPGTGIGLSLVSGFAKLHGGRAWVEDRPGGGSVFRVQLPAGAPATAVP